MPNSTRTDGERLATIEAKLTTLIEETGLQRANGHARLREDNEFRGDVKTRLSLIEQGQKEMAESVRSYQSDCTRDREDFEGRLDDAERQIGETGSLRRYVVSTVAAIVGLIGLAVNIAAWARR